MIKFLIITLLLSGCSATRYVKANLQYASHEMLRAKTDARKIHVEAGVKKEFGRLTLSCSAFHDSQPFVHGIEYYKTGVQVGLEYEWD